MDVGAERVTPRQPPLTGRLPCPHATTMRKVEGPSKRTEGRRPHELMQTAMAVGTAPSGIHNSGHVPSTGIALRRRFG